MKRTIRLGGALLALALIVGACGAAATPTPAPATPTAVPATPAPTPTPPAGLSGELTFWHSYGSGAGTEGDALEQVLAVVRAANPDLTINVLEVPFDQLFNKFNTDAAAGGGPDMFIAPNDSLGDQVRAGLLLDLDTYLAGKLPNVSDVSINGSKVGGKFYMVPESLKAVAMFYNSAAVATPPATTDELLAAVQGGMKLGIFQGSYHNFGWWAAFGGKLMDDNGKCIADQGGVAEAHAFLAQLKEAGAQFYPDYAAFSDAFKAGQLDAIIDGPWATGGYKEPLGADLAVAPIPAGPGGPAQPLTGVDGWYINANAKNPDLAVAFALLMVGAENEQVFVDVAGHIPSDTTITIADPITLKFAEAVATGFPRPQNPELGAFWGNFGDALNKVIDAGVDPTEAIGEACTKMNEANNK